MRALAWLAGPIRPHTPGVEFLHYQLEEQIDSRRRWRNGTMPEVIDRPMESADNNRQDDAQRICARDEGPRTSDSGEHCSVSLSTERTRLLRKDPARSPLRPIVSCHSGDHWLSLGPGPHVRIHTALKWPERTVPENKRSLQDPGNHAQVRGLDSPREELRVPRGRVPPRHTATDSLAFRIRYRYRLVFHFVYRFRYRSLCEYRVTAYNRDGI